ncbi:hypothetical protein CLOM_g10350 [Closterium sp. NIES-68]|nr:hypothetical protein CLOM_g10350 [Closterium sp. NIES-68]
MAKDDTKRRKRGDEDGESDGERDGKRRRGDGGGRERREKERRGGRREKGERRRKRHKKRRSLSDADSSSPDWSGSSRNSSGSERDGSSDADSGSSSDDHSKSRERRREKREKREKRGREKEKRRGKERRKEKEREAEGGSAEELLERDLRRMMREFPLDVSHDLVRLLERVDGGDAVDVGGIPDRALKKLLGSIFGALGIDSEGKSSKTRHLYQLASAAPRCLPRVVPLVAKLLQNLPDPDAAAAGGDGGRGEEWSGDMAEAARKKRCMGPAMPTAAQMQAAAALTRAVEDMEEAEQALEDSPFVGPMPPAVIAEAANATQAEKYEEVERILDPELNAYAIVGVTAAAGDGEIKKRYWKASLLVHPDKCSHPRAQEAFLRLNDAVNRLKDPTKRSLVDAEIAAREERRAMESELKALREAAEWRKLRGEALPGDDELLGVVRKGVERETWMTELPPERQAGPPAQTNTFFSRSDKVGRGDTSAWTDTPEQRASRAKQQYLEAYSSATNALEGPSADSAAALQSQQDKCTAALVDKLAAQKQAVSLVEQHRKKQGEESKKKEKEKKGKGEKGKGKGKGKGESEGGGGGERGWRMWDREKDLEVKPKAMKWTADGMAQGLSGRFSGSQSGSRKFL